MRQIININKDWRFSKKPQSTPTALPTDWESVDLPHTWNGTDGQDGGNDYYRGKCAYAKALTADELGSAPVHYLQFDGVNSGAQVYWNGQQIAKHDGGYSTFRAKRRKFCRRTCWWSMQTTAPMKRYIPRWRISPSTAAFTGM